MPLVKTALAAALVTIGANASPTLASGEEHIAKGRRLANCCARSAI
jgi:hypothetical protein